MKLLEARGVTKSFGDNHALVGASLSVAGGSIHGIIGPNGAGKSTLLKIVCGMVRRDAGEISIGGTNVGQLSIQKGRRLGLAIVPQETELCDGLLVSEAIVLGAEPKIAGAFASRRMIRRVAASCLEEMNVELPLERRVFELSGAARRLTMFAQVVHRRSKVIIVDEPTAGLDEQDAETVVAELEKLRAPDRAIIFVSHRFSEVLRLCDRVTAIRDGQDICTLEETELTSDVLGELILGGDPDGGSSRRTSNLDQERSVVLRAVSVNGRQLRDVSVSLACGEILGLAGLAESGVEELLECLGGQARPSSGQLFADEREVVMRSPADAVARGIAYLPADRTRAVLADAPVRINVAMPRWKEIASANVITSGMERREIADVLARLRLTQYCDRPLGSLSGGNRQKALIARALRSGARTLILGNPTAGVDVRGTAEIHGIIRELADEGYGIVVSSSEPEEIAALSDRVVVMHRGGISAELRGSSVTPKRVIGSMF